MAESTRDREASLAQFLAARAKRSSDARLALDVAVGFIAALIAVIWRGPAWFLVAAAALVFASYGSWAIADRELKERNGAGRLLRASRMLSAVLGFVATAALVLAAFAIALGTVIS